MEKWIDVKGFDGYKVSNLGRVKKIKPQYIFEKSRNRYMTRYLKDYEVCKKTFSINKYGKEKAKNLIIDFINNHEIVSGDYIMNQSIDKDGYCVLGLCKNKKVFYKFVHRVMLESFVDKPFENAICNHKNGIKNDNRLSNLEWSTYKYNTYHSIHVLGNKHGKTYKPILCIEENKIFNTSYEAALWINNTLYNNKKKINSLASGIRKACMSNVVKYKYHWSRTNK